MATLSVTGPCSGDLYGIAGELLRTIKERGIDLLALNYSVLRAIIGVVPLDQIQPAIRSVRAWFEARSVNQKDV